MAIRHLRAILDLNKRNYPDIRDKGQAIYNGFVAHPDLFVTPSPALPVFLAKLQAFDLAQQAAGMRTKGAVAVRDQKAGELITCMETARSYVQALIDASPEQGMTLITAAAMVAAQTAGHDKPLLQATQAIASGPVHVVANVGLLTAGLKGKCFFNWQYTADGGKTFVNAPSTPHGRTDVAGLTALTTYGFRVSAISETGTGEWSQVVTLLVR